MERRSPSCNGSLNTSASASPLPCRSTFISPSMSPMLMEEDGGDDHKMRVCMMGDTQVGKSSLVSQFMTSEHIKDFDATLGGFLSLLSLNFTYFCS